MAKETDEVVEFLLALGEAGALALEDGHIGLGDALYFFDAFRKLGPALDNIDKVPAELAAWTEVDTAALVNTAADFNIPEANIEAVVKDAIKIAGPLVEFLAKFHHKG